MIDWVAVGSFATAFSTAFVAWEAYESQQSNRLEIKHNQNIELQHQKENSVKAIIRFDDEILPDVRHLLRVDPKTLSKKDYLLIITVILKINRWSVFITAGIANNSIIKSRLHDTLRNISIQYMSIAKRINDSGAYNISSYIDLLKEFDII